MSVDDAELLSGLHASLGPGVELLSRQPSPYATSAAIETVDVRTDAGARVGLILKDMSADALLAEARGIKPGFLYDPGREIDAYRLVLDGAGLGTATCHAAFADARRRRYWLALERIPGVELFQVGELDRWCHVARWLADAHARLAPHAQRPDDAAGARLLRHDRAWLGRWRQRAERVAAGAPGIGRVARAHARAADELLALPVTVVHGELFASNVLLAGPREDERVCAVDWEMAAIGPGLGDLAALVSGDWAPADRRAIACAYHGSGAAAAAAARALGLCRLQLCVQMLGWSEDWAPPDGHGRDWLGDALELVEELGL